MNKKQKINAQGRLSQGPSKSRRVIVDGYFVPRAMFMLSWKARKTVSLPEQANCNGFTVMLPRTGAVKGACTVTEAARD